MDINYPTDEELFPNLFSSESDHEVEYLEQYRCAVRRALDDLTEEEIADIARHGKNGSVGDNGILNPFQQWYPIWNKREKWHATEAELAFRKAILDGTINGTPGIRDMWISNGVVEYTYRWPNAGGTSQFQAVIRKDGTLLGPHFPNYPSYKTSIGDDSDPSVSQTDIAFSIFDSKVMPISSEATTPFFIAQKWLEQKKSGTLGCSPPVVLIFILLTALCIYLRNRSPLFEIMMCVFGFLSLIGLLSMIVDAVDKRKSKRNAGKDEFVINSDGKYIFNFSEKEIAKIKLDMEQKRMDIYRYLRYFKIWRERLKYEKQIVIYDCNGKNVAAESLKKLDSEIAQLENYLAIAASFPSTDVLDHLKQVY